MKLIFLDIDGVMNSVGDRFSYSLETDYHFELLKRIVGATCARIVLSSSWRISEDGRNIVQKRLGDFGMEFIGCTPFDPNKGHVERGEEIRKYLMNSHGEDIESFVILDDEGDMCEFKDKHLVQTCQYKGLQIDDMLEAIMILNNQIRLKKIYDERGKLVGVESIFFKNNLERKPKCHYRENYINSVKEKNKK